MAAPHFADDLTARKRAMRAAMRLRRAPTPDETAALTDHLLAADALAPPAAVSAFWPLPGEIDLRPLMAALCGRGQAVLLPVTRRDLPLTFRAWAPGDGLQRERFGTLCPGPEAPLGVPDVLLVPLAAFDRAGRRLGRGGGHYDRTLAALPGRPAIGVALAAWEVDEVPAGPHDRRLSLVVTEAGPMRVAG